MNQKSSWLSFLDTVTLPQFNNEEPGLEIIIVSMGMRAETAPLSLLLYRGIMEYHWYIVDITSHGRLILVFAQGESVIYSHLEPCEQRNLWLTHIIDVGFHLLQLYLWFSCLFIKAVYVVQI